MYQKQKHQEVSDIFSRWQLDTGLRLEYKPYSQGMLSNVNNYVAIKTDGSVVQTGARYSYAGLKHLPAGDVCKTAVINYLKNGTPLEQTIHSCDDLRGFLFARTVKGGALWNNEKIGSIARWYWGLSATDTIVYASNKNRVPMADRSRPIINLFNPHLIDNIDIDRYVEHAYDLLADGGIDLRNPEMEL